MDISERVCDLEAQYGGLRAAASAVGIDAGYLSKLRAGTKTNPSKKTLAKLGLKKETTYVISS